MPSLRMLSGGAAQGLVNALAPQFQAETGFGIEAEFGAVGAMATKLRAGTPADISILTSALIERLVREGYVAAGSSAEIGVVHTGVAVRAGSPPLRIADVGAFRAALLAADAIYAPDLMQSTAGAHFAKVLETLGIRHEVASRLKEYPNGATAMRQLAASESTRPIGCTQVTEILNTPGTTLIGPLPAGCELATVYTAAIGANAAAPQQAGRLIALLTSDGARDVRARAGFA